MSAVVPFSIFIHGWVRGWNTEERFRTQLAECVHFPDCQIIVISPLEYSFVMLSLSMIYEIVMVGSFSSVLLKYSENGWFQIVGSCDYFLKMYGLYN